MREGFRTMPYRGEKKRLERRCLRLETRQPFEPCEPVTVHRTGQSDRGLDGSMLFSHGMVPYLKRTVKPNGSRVSRLDRTVRSGFNNLEEDINDLLGTSICCYSKFSSSLLVKLILGCLLVGICRMIMLFTTLRKV